MGYVKGASLTTCPRIPAGVRPFSCDGLALVAILYLPCELDAARKRQEERREIKTRRKLVQTCCRKQ